MTTGPEHRRTAASGRVHLTASQADREGVIDALKAAYVADRLTEDEFEARVGLAFAARTHTDLAAITADIPERPVAAQAAGIPDRVVAWGTGAIIAAAALGGAVLIGGSAWILWAIIMTGVLLFTVSVLLAARQEQRSRGGRPPRSALAGPSGPAGGPALEGKAPGHYYALRSYWPGSGSTATSHEALRPRHRKKLLRWYPRVWRERYGEEFLAMVEDSLDGRRPGWRLRQAAAGQGRAGTMTMPAGIPQLFRLL